MVYSALINAIWTSKKVPNCPAELAENHIYEHLPVHFYGTLSHLDKKNGLFGVKLLDDHRDFNKLHLAMKEYYPTRQPLDTEFLNSYFVAVKMDDFYFRGEVLRCQKDNGRRFAIVLLIDFGMYKRVPMENCYDLMDEFCEGEFETAGAIICKLPDQVNMFKLGLPNCAVFEKELQEKAPIEVIVLSYSTSQPQACLAVMGSCIPNAFNSLNVDHYFLGHETNAYHLIKSLKNNTQIDPTTIDQFLMEVILKQAYQLADKELTTESSTVVLLKNNTDGGKIFVRTVVSSLRLAFIQDLLQQVFSMPKVLKYLMFQPAQVKNGLPCVVCHPDTHRFYRAQITGSSCDNEIISVKGIDNPAFKFKCALNDVYHTPLLFLDQPEILQISSKLSQSIDILCTEEKNLWEDEKPSCEAKWLVEGGLINARYRLERSDIIALERIANNY